MKKNKSENLLEKIPVRKDGLGWNADQDGAVTLEVENKGIFNTLAQKLLKKPRISYIHLDRLGSFIWQIIDGESDILTLGKRVEERFGDQAQPIYERLAKYMKILESYSFIELK